MQLSSYVKMKQEKFMLMDLILQHCQMAERCKLEPIKMDIQKHFIHKMKQ